MIEYETFLYEINIKDKRVELIYSKFYRSNKALKDRNKSEYVPNKKKAEIIYSKLFTMVGAPVKYIENLPKPKLKKNEKRNRTVRNRKI